MIMMSSKCKINGIFVTEITISDRPNAQRNVEAVYALGEVDKKGTGHLIHGTHGRCTAYTNNWSKDTMEILDQLIKSMEEDLLPRHFEVTAGMEDKDEGIEPGEDEGTNQI